MNINLTKIEGVCVVENQNIHDIRGHFSRFFCQQGLANVMEKRRILQINHSLTIQKGTVRGFHYQKPPHAEMKLVRCIKGSVWDVVVDLRYGSSTFLQWHAEELSADNARLMVIPEGCAHGFQVLQDNCELLYLHTAYYAPNAEGGIHVQDPVLSVDWPLPVERLSERDKNQPAINDSFSGIML